MGELDDLDRVDGLVEITPRLIGELTSLRGGYTRAVILAIGGEWPAKKGWRRRVIGNKVSAVLLSALVDDMRRRAKFLLPNETGSGSAGEKKSPKERGRDQKKINKRTRAAMRPRRAKSSAPSWPPPRTAATPENYRKTRDAFLASAEWRRLRYATLVRYGAKCLACGADRRSGAAMHVDHIKPMWTHWDLRADPENLQVLCEDCNLGKGAGDTTDWRS